MLRKGRPRRSNAYKEKQKSMNHYLHPVVVKEGAGPEEAALFSFPNNLALAPMAGASDLGFRRLCKQEGAGFTCTELVSARGLRYSGLAPSWRYLVMSEEEAPAALQLFGAEPEDFVYAVEKLLEEPRLPKPALIDINMGCPVQKVVKTGAGAALLLDPPRAAAIVRALRRYLEQRGEKIAISCKIRIGFAEGENCAAGFADRLLDAGACLLSVHGRTRAQQYSGTADWSAIREVVERVHENYPQVPVYANGDIRDLETARSCLEQTGAEGLMIGRAAMGNPWIFRRLRAGLQLLNGSPLSEQEKASLLAESQYEAPFEAKKTAILLQYRGYLEGKTELLACRELRKVLGWYLHGEHQAAELRRQAMSIDTEEKLLDFLAYWEASASAARKSRNSFLVADRSSSVAER